MPKTRTLLALVLLPLLVFLVACGGGDDDGDNGSTSQPTAGDASGSTGTTPGSTSPSGDASPSSSGGADASTVLGNCPELVSMFGAFTAGAFANPGAGTLDGDLQDLAQVFQNAADNAPSEIQADMQVLADAFTGFYTALADLGVDFSNPATFATLDASQLAQLETVFSSLDSPELEQASDNLDAWFTENCE